MVGCVNSRIQKLKIEYVKPCKTNNILQAELDMVIIRNNRDADIKKNKGKHIKSSKKKQWDQGKVQCGENKRIASEIEKSGVII